MIEPSLQGEIKLSKDALKACRELVVECMVRDGLLDSHGSGTGTLLVAGDEEGQLSPSQAKAAMPIAQFVLRQYINAAHNLNHRLPDVEQGLHADGVTGHGLRGSINVTSSSGHAGHGSMHSTAALGAPVPPLSAIDQRSEYAAVLQDMENQQRLFTKARAMVRRKKDILAKNLETILFAYGGSVGRVKDFFSCLYTYFVGARYRPEILGLLCQFIRRQVCGSSTTHEDVTCFTLALFGLIKYVFDPTWIACPFAPNLGDPTIRLAVALTEGIHWMIYICAQHIEYLSLGLKSHRESTL